MRNVLLMWGVIAALIIAGAVFSKSHAEPAPSVVHTQPWNIADTFGSVVEIETATGLGTGIVVDKDLVFTARHVVDSVGEGGRVTVRFIGGRKVVGEVDHAIDGFDLAVIRVDTDGETGIAPVCRRVVLGEHIYAVGFPAGIPYFVSDGIIASIATQGEASYGFTAFISAPVYQGMSGGPVFSSTGELIGITVMKMGNDGFGPGMIIPMSQIISCPKEETTNEPSPSVPGH